MSFGLLVRESKQFENLTSHHHKPKFFPACYCFFPLQAYSCGRWRSSESKRLSTSVLAMTWPPSCHAASPWSTPTPRTSPSSTKETGWSDDDQGESKRSSAGSRGQTCSGAPHPKALQSTPRHQRVLPTLDKSENTVVAHFSSVELFLSHHICVSLLFVFGGESPRRPCRSL